MFDQLPQNVQDAYDWTWDNYKPYADNLLARELTAATVDAWLTDMSALEALISEVYGRLYVATTVNTADETAKKRFFAFLENVMEPAGPVRDALNRQLIDSGLEPDGMAIPLRDIRASVELFQEANIPLFTELQKLGNEYDEIVGAMTVDWDGEEKTIPQITAVLENPDRPTRERAWRGLYSRRLQDRERLNELWVKMLDIRVKIANNAGLPDFRAYQWKALGRHDYTPEDDLRFLDAIEQVVVPAVSRLLEKRKAKLGLDTLRPWDMAVDTTGDAPLEPFANAQELIAGAANVFSHIDPDLSRYYNTMRDSNMLDLDNRKNKAPGGYCIGHPYSQETFIFMNAVGQADDVQTLLHESGHAFHNFESNPLPYQAQRDYPTEFAEVASMSMELLAGPYLSKAHGGYYDEPEAARARLAHLYGIIQFWPYMSVVDAFQHWVYTNADEARIPANCDAKWNELWDRFMPGVDWTGLEEERKTGWQRKLHIYQIPFYYIEYGLAQLGAVQVWTNSLTDPAQALTDYRSGLSLGNTRPLPELFAAAGAKLAFDAETLGAAVSQVEKTIGELEAAL